MEAICILRVASLFITVFFSLILLGRILNLFFFFEKPFLLRSDTLHVLSLIFTVSLFCFGIWYENQTDFRFLDTLFHSLEYTLDTVALSFKDEAVSKAVSESECYSIAFSLSYISSVVVSGSLILRLFFGNVITAVRLSLVKKAKHTIVLGDDVNARTYASQLKTPVVLWHLAKIDRQHYKKNLINVSHMITVDYLKKLVHSAKGHFVSFLQGDDSIQFLKILGDFLTEYPSCNMMFYLEYAHINNRFFDEIMKKFPHLIYPFNTYEMCARKLILDHPVSEFLTANQVDHRTALVKPHVAINILLLGYGKVNQKYHALSLFCHVFATLTDGILSGKEVNYHVFDRDSEIINPDFYEYLQYESSLHRLTGNVEKCDYFDPPHRRDTMSYHKMDLFDGSQYENISRLFTPGSYNQILVSFDDDSKNLEIALKILESIERWGPNRNFDFQVFVRIRSDSFLSLPIVTELLKQKRIIAYGSDQEILTEENIVQEKLDSIAYTRNFYYQLSHGQSDKTPLALWRELPYNKRLSNRYSGISIPFILFLMGISYMDVVSGKVKKDEFLSLYDPDNTLQWDDNSQIKYSLDTLRMRSDPRHVLAFIEHERWTAFYLFCGYLPMKKSEIHLIKDSESGKMIPYKDDHARRLHACLTTHTGLIEYRDLLDALYKQAGQPQSLIDLDVIKYDFQLMDYLFEEIKQPAQFTDQVSRRRLKNH
ncbi:MAG: hypothetical protein A2Y16_00060 [Tenericutes bacterium GWF2_57_13]|nr:MAG: hypothetical protein A2Y16_00060 [Tenericutes bacterium GWF2_57_13]